MKIIYLSMIHTTLVIIVDDQNKLNFLDITPSLYNYEVK